MIKKSESVIVTLEDYYIPDSIVAVAVKVSNCWESWLYHKHACVSVPIGCGAYHVDSSYAAAYCCVNWGTLPEAMKSIRPLLREAEWWDDDQDIAEWIDQYAISED